LVTLSCRNLGSFGCREQAVAWAKEAPCKWVNHPSQWQSKRTLLSSGQEDRPRGSGRAERELVQEVESSGCGPNDSEVSVQARPLTRCTAAPTAISPPSMTKQLSASLPSKRR